MRKLAIEYRRYLKMNLPVGQSTFLWGARKTGKSFYLKHHFPESIYYDFLQTDLYFRFLKEPQLFREEILALDEGALAHPIIIDEIQKIPVLLDEVHWLIENSEAYFILCGSSARKLKRDGVNLLGGRSWRYEFFPLVFPEVPDFDLLHALNNGLIPSHYSSKNWSKTIKAYVNDYLKEEIKAEGLVRNLAGFAQFLDIAAFSNGEILNYANIARDCGVDAKTIKEYYQILVDTLIGYYLYPYRNKTKREDLVATPKFYFFDVGVTNGIIKRTISQLKGAEAGNAFEHYIFLELWAYKGLHDFEFEIQFWRTNSGLEVDCILGDAEVAIEVKIGDRIRSSDIHGLIAFQKEYQPKSAIVVCTAPRRRKMMLPNGQSIDILPWKTFLEMLWKGEIIKSRSKNVS
jgi:predicted AAA+ superfamily ATPase